MIELIERLRASQSSDSVAVAARCAAAELEQLLDANDRMAKARDWQADSIGRLTKALEEIEMEAQFGFDDERPKWQALKNIIEKCDRVLQEHEIRQQGATDD